MIKKLRVFLDANILILRAGVDYLVSTDRDFTDVDDTTVELRRHLNPIRAGSFLREVMGWAPEELSTIERRQWTDLEQPFWEEADG